MAEKAARDIVEDEVIVDRVTGREYAVVGVDPAPVRAGGPWPNTVVRLKVAPMHDRRKRQEWARFPLEMLTMRDGGLLAAVARQRGH